MFIIKRTVAVLALLSLGACGSPPDKSGSGGAESRLTDPGQSQFQQRNLAEDGTSHKWPAQIGDRVFFDVDKSVVRGEGKELLVKWVAFLKQNPTERLLIEGHSDEHGTREYNLALGDRRANAVREFLVVSGVPAERLKTVSLGKERPAVIGSDETAWSQNRRAVGILM